MAQVRIDQLLVDTELVESRQKAQALIMAGDVLVNEQRVEKSGKQVPSDAVIRLLGQRPPFASRAGGKLDAAMESFAVDVQGAVCLDIGASTGGFTDCLLQRGAARVYAVDVGSGQLHWRLRQDNRVVVVDKLNARNLELADIGERIRFVSCDVSFISVTKILPRLPGVLQIGAEAVVLAKPQFEVGKGEVGRGGVVRDSRKHREVVEKIVNALVSLGFGDVQSMESPVLGATGNQEFLVHGRNWIPVGSERP